MVNLYDMISIVCMLVFSLYDSLTAPQWNCETVNRVLTANYYDFHHNQLPLYVHVYTIMGQNLYKYKHLCSAGSFEGYSHNYYHTQSSAVSHGLCLNELFANTFC